MPNHMVEYLIIGNSAAGVSAAEAIRSADLNGSILIVGAEPYPAYGRPLISYMVEGKTTEDKIWFRSENFYADLHIDTMLGANFEVVKLDAKNHLATLANNETINYKKCLIATGSIPFVPPIEGLNEIDNVHAFMTLDDAKGAWRATEQATAFAHEHDRTSKVLVIGAGLIGLKAAEALSYHADEVVVLELAPRILPAVLDDAGAKILQSSLLQHGIICMPGVSAQKFRSANDRIEALLTNGESIECDVVITAVGVRPNSAIAVEAGAEQGRGLICNERLETTLSDVYAAGDVVQVCDVLDGSQRPLALWPNAINQGRLAGAHMAGYNKAESFNGSFAINAVDFFDVSLLTSGVINPQEDFACEQFVVSADDHYSKFVVRDGKLVGYILLNAPDNAGIYTYLIENSIPLETIDDDIFQNAPTNLNFGDEKRWERLHPFYPNNLDKRGWKQEEC